ncbi:MAG: hypothetical protein R3286_05490 [Gammaproteobacteria bacterium]|nr:hypothetical protein [Gammaproteobacteria bacterium]
MPRRFPVVLLVLVLPCAVPAYEPCGVRLDGVSTSSGRVGDVLVLHGAWGESQGKKIPVINRGGMHRLEVVAWSADAIVARVPADLGAGRYRVGVYCNDFSEGGTYSSGFTDFLVLGTPRSAHEAARRESLTRDAVAAAEGGRFPAPADDPDPAAGSRRWPSLPALVGWTMLIGAGLSLAWLALRRRS